MCKKSTGTKRKEKEIKRVLGEIIIWKLKIFFKIQLDKLALVLYYKSKFKERNGICLTDSHPFPTDYEI